MTQDKLALIRQSLAAAESSIKTAKQLLSELESGGLKPSAKDLPGETGIFDGTNMVTAKGEIYPIPANYASKSLLVTGDTLKLVDEDGEKRFKQIEHVKRHKTTGILHKKDGKFKVITPEGSYNVLGASIEHFKGEVGDEVTLQLPAGNLTVAYGAVESIHKPGQSVSTEAAAPSKPTSLPVAAKKAPEASTPKQAPKEAVKPAPKPPVRSKPVSGPAAKTPAAKAAPAKPVPAPAPVVLGEDDLR